jgi:hypothetical protein
MQTAYQTLDDTKIMTHRELAAALKDLKRNAPLSKNRRLNLAILRLRTTPGDRMIELLPDV